VIDARGILRRTEYCQKVLSFFGEARKNETVRLEVSKLAGNYLAPARVAPVAQMDRAADF
jgi:hypothetical protein